MKARNGKAGRLISSDKDGSVTAIATVIARFATSLNSKPTKEFEQGGHDQ